MKHTIPLLLVISSMAYAQDREPSWERISKHDTNNDGKVTQAEFRGPDKVFTRFDANNDGSITETEMKNVQPRGERGSQGKRSSKADNAPQVGSVAPQLKALKLGSKDMVDLGNIKKTTILIFGSYT